VKKKLSAKVLKATLAKIKVLILDIDGVLTDGRIFYMEGTGWGASYSVIDGYGIRQLMKAGVEVCFISGGNFVSHRKRAELLGVKLAFFGNENKIGPYEEIKKTLSVTDKECLYVADELFDIPLLEKVAFAACPPHAPLKVKKVCNYITKREGGFGCAREVVDMILEARSGSV